MKSCVISMQKTLDLIKLEKNCTNLKAPTISKSSTYNQSKNIVRQSCFCSWCEFRTPISLLNAKISEKQVKRNALSYFNAEKTLRNGKGLRVEILRPEYFFFCDADSDKSKRVTSISDQTPLWEPLFRNTVRQNM